MEGLTFTISEELFNEMCKELSNDIMTKMLKENIHNQNFKESKLEVPQVKTPPPKPTLSSIQKKPF